MLARALIGFVWLCESANVEQSEKITSLLFVIDATGNIFAALYFKYVSKNWAYFYAVPAIMMLVSALILLFFFQDSPKFYYGTKQYDKARECLTAIGHRNGTLSLDE